MVVDVAVFMQRQVRLRGGILLQFLQHFSTSVLLDVEAQVGGDAGSLSDSRAFCHTN